LDPAAKIREWLHAASSVTALTGAGISAESGIPTFRGPGGIWRTYRAEDLATPRAFARNPNLVWEWYDWRRSVVAKAEPNARRRALAEMEAELDRRGARFALVTQNVDGLHDRAGSTNVFRVHGDLWTLRCTQCGREWRDLRPSLPELPPICECGAMARPGVVWFGEGLPERVWADAVDAVSGADLVFVIGTSSVVYPAAGLAELAKSAGARVVEINIADTPVSGIVDLCWRAPAAEALPQLG
jgi:NAD-dependent deacetylase